MATHVENFSRSVKANPTVKKSNKVDFKKLAANDVEELEPITEESVNAELTEILEDQKIEPQPVKEEKPNLRAYLKSKILEGKYTQRQILDEAHTAFPHLLKATISTILSDSKNVKYAKFKNEKGELMLVKVDEKGIYSFSK